MQADPRILVDNTPPETVHLAMDIKAAFRAMEEMPTAEYAAFRAYVRQCERRFDFIERNCGRPPLLEAWSFDEFESALIEDTAFFNDLFTALVKMMTTKSTMMTVKTMTKTISFSAVTTSSHNQRECRS